MPTHNRRSFVPAAVRYFLRQDYPRKELIVVDDGTDPIGDLLPADERIRYVRLNQRISVGAKRNLACEHARGSIIAHWDDDDWSAPHRLRYQVESLHERGADVCGINRLLLYDVHTQRAWWYIYPADQRLWLSGASLCYRRAFWSRHRFVDIDVGEDAYFVWNAPPAKLMVLEDSTFHVSVIHGGNVSPKQTNHPWWHACPVDEVHQILGSDQSIYAGDRPAVSVKLRDHEVTPGASVRNVFACLVHESPECVVDLVRNLSHLDPASKIVLYNGSRNPELLRSFPFERYGVLVHPNPKPQSWGRLHEFAIECMQLCLRELPFDTLTIVDSDQLAVRRNYSAHIGQYLARHPGVGFLGNAPHRQPSNTRVAPAEVAFAEVNLWRPFLRRFPSGEEHFVHWSFWPSSVFSADAARDLTRLFATDAQLQSILSQSRIWATEEVILPTLVALLGHTLEANPCSYEYVRYRVPYTQSQVNAALARSDVFWMHPVARRPDDPLRKRIRAGFNHYFASPRRSGGPMPLDGSANGSELLLVLPILSAMNAVEGWLEYDEADLLLAASLRAFATLEPRVAVEVGSYCGRSTVVLGSAARASGRSAVVHAIDPHDGKVGALDQGLVSGSPTLEVFERNIAAAGLSEYVRTIRKRSLEVEWSGPISFLFVDGLHDYASVAADFYHFQSHVVAGGLVAFHDYADYYPGVKALVDEILDSGEYRPVQCVRSMMVIQKVHASPPALSPAGTP